MQLDHKHSSPSDLFPLIIHGYKNSGRQEAKEVDQSLRTANIPFNQGKHTILANRVSLLKNNYYNLSKFERRLSKQNQLIYTIASLK